MTISAMTLLLALAPGISAYAQIETQAEPTFFFEAVSYSSDQPGKARVDLYVQVPYEELRFVKEGGQFVARYDVTLGFYNAQGQMEQERTWTEIVRVTDFTQTTSSRFYSLSHRAVEVPPGNYQANVQILDQDSRKTARRRRNLLVTDFAKDSLSLSDIMLVSRLSTAGEKRSIVPNISGNVGHLTEGFFLFFEVYSRAMVDSVVLTWKVLDQQNKELHSQSQEESINGNVTQAFMKVDQLHLAAGTYLLTIEAIPLHPSEDSSGLLAKTSRTFSVRWSDLPPSIEDLDKATDQMRYVARESEMEYIREAPDAEVKRQRFLEFWKKRDPDPGTDVNELMDEYYVRVAFANRTFQHYIEGWRTDRGMVYIYLGPPDNIERYPFQNNAKPYEIWYYNQFNRQYVFVDESGFGDYRLRSPVTDLWDRVR
ncbi:MAG: GWxTD domain-containing protein [Ignavibacteriae bacterium]|nr:GWxTD domain-containing protein [Ignavibacteriota bacterium]